MPGPAPRPRLRLRPTILVWFSGLIVVTVAAIGAFAYAETRHTLEFLTRQHLESVAHSTRAEVRHLLTPAARILTELDLLAQQGVLPEDPRDLGMVFVERMRQNPEIGWLGYAHGADRSFTGGTRSDQAGLRWYRTDPAVSGGVSTEFTVDEAGRWTAQDSASPDPYDPTTRPWYTTAIAHPELTWHEPYQFANGQWGISITRGVVHDGEVVGVLLADYFLDDVTAFLEQVQVGRTGRVEIVTPSGLVLGDTEAYLSELLQHVEREGVHDLDVHGEPHRVVWEPLEIDGGLSWDIAVLVPEGELLGLARANATKTVGVGLLAVIFALLGATWFSNTVSRSVRQMSAMMERIARLDLPDEPPPTSPIHEIHVMGRAMSAMEAGLKSFSRYVPVDLVRTLLESGVEARLGGEPRRISVMFSDIANFTTLVESTPHQVVVDALGEYLGEMDRAIGDTEGIVSQYLGDGILAYWGAPTPHEDHEVRACLGVLAMRAASHRLVQQARDRGSPLLHTRFGINSGEAVVGNIGAPNRFNYSALGDSVNTAARLEGLNKVYGTEVLVGEATAERVRHRIVLRAVDVVRMKGKEQGVRVYELVGEVGEVDEATLDGLRTYERALAAYQAGQFAEALAGFEAVDDPPSRVMAARCRELAASPPPEDWDGIVRMTTK